MRIKQIKLYSISELSEDARESAYEEWLQSAEYFWGDENRDTLDAFERIFPVHVKDFGYGYRTGISWNMTDLDFEEVLEFTGIRLLKWIINNYWHELFKPKYRKSIENHTIKHRRIKHETLSNGQIHSTYHSGIFYDNCCILTGYCIDDDILQPLYEFIKNPDGRTLEDLMNDCLHAWVFACNADYEASMTIEFFVDHAKANDYEFTADGKLY